MVRARGGANRGGYRGSLSASNASRGRKRRKNKKNRKFAEYAKNFVDQSDSDSQDSLSSTESSVSSNVSEICSNDINTSQPSSPYTTIPSTVDHASNINNDFGIIKSPVLLPPSSGDLLIESTVLMQALGVFEAVRHFGRILKISPFAFEDFNAALLAQEESILIAELHISLLKALLAHDETNQISLGSIEEKDMIALQLQLLDQLTWPDVLREYIKSDIKFMKYLYIVENKDYPLVSAESSLAILTWLVDNVLCINSIREEIANEGLFISDDHCRRCGKMGELLCCELCPAVYHLECLVPVLNEVPDNEWLCPVCEANQVKGVTDVLSELDRIQVYRNEPLGYDCHGRVYWFMARRIIVEGNFDVFYYSCQEHLDELLDALHEKEEDLHFTIQERYEEISRHMKITEELYDQRKGSLYSILVKPRQKGALVESKDAIQTESKVINPHTEDEKVEVKLKFVSDDDIPQTIKRYNEVSTLNSSSDIESDVKSLLDKCVSDVAARVNTEIDELAFEIKKEFKDFQDEIRCKNLHEAATEIDHDTPLDKTAGQQHMEPTENMAAQLLAQEQVDGDIPLEVVDAEIKIDHPTEMSSYFKLGMDNVFHLYKNQYSCNPLAKSRNALQLEKDRKKYVNNKFLINEFSWIDHNFSKTMNFVVTLQNTLLKLETGLPHAFLHPLWYKLRTNWVAAVRQCSAVTDFAVVLLYLEAMVKPIIIVDAWNESCGSLKFTRIQGELKNKANNKLKQKLEKEKMIDVTTEDIVTDDETERLTSKIPVKFRWIPRHTVWEQKGEEYRLGGTGAWLWKCHYKKKNLKIRSRNERMKNLEKLLTKLKVKKGKRYLRNSKLNVIQNNTSDYNKDELLYSSEEDESPPSPKQFIKKMNDFNFTNELDEDNKSYGFKFGVKCQSSDLLWSQKTRMHIVRLTEPTKNNIEDEKAISSKPNSSATQNNNIQTDAIVGETPAPVTLSDLNDTDSSTPHSTGADATQESLPKESILIDSKSVIDIAQESLPKENILADSKPVLNITRESLPKENILADSKPVLNITRESLPKENILADSKPVLNITRESLPKENILADSKPVLNITRESLPKENILADSKPVLDITQESLPKENALVDSKPVLDVTQAILLKENNLIDSKPVLDITQKSFPKENILVDSKPVLDITQTTLLKDSSPLPDPNKTTEASLLASSISIAHRLIDGKNTVKVQQKTADEQPSNVVISLPSTVSTVDLPSSSAYLKTTNPVNIITNGSASKPGISALQRKPLTNFLNTTPTTTLGTGKKTLALNSNSNNMLMQALAAAGIKSVDGKILAFRATNGNYIIKTSSKGASIPSLQLSSTASNIGKTQVLRQSQPLMGLSQVMPKTTSVPPLICKLNGNLTGSAGKEIQTPKTIVQNYTSTFLANVESKIRRNCVRNYESASALINGQKRRISSARNGVKCIFMLPKHELRDLARNAGLKEVKRGFLYNSKISTTWPEYIPRPTIGVVWRYRLSEARHLACVGLLFRLFHASLKWNLINEKAPKGAKRVITSNKGIITIQVLEGEPISADGLTYRYKVKKQYQPFKIQKKTKLEKPASPKVADASTPIARKTNLGIKLRERVTPMKYTLDEDHGSSSSEDENGEVFPKQRSTVIKWKEEACLDPWEVRQYWDRVRTERNLKSYQSKKVSDISRVTNTQIPLKKMLADSAIKRAKMGIKQQALKKSAVVQPAQLTLKTVGPTIIPKPIKFPGIPSLSTSSLLTTKYPSTIGFKQNNNTSRQAASFSKFGVKNSNATFGRRMSTDPDFLIANSVLDNLLRKVDTIERKEKRKRDRQLQSMNKQKELIVARRNTLLQERKERLRLEILRKREILEELILSEVRVEIAPNVDVFDEQEPTDLTEPSEELDVIADDVDVSMTVDEPEEKPMVEEINEVVEPVKKKKKKAIKEKSIDEKLYCVCKTPYDATKFYVGCDLCNDWFHGSCVGVTEKSAKSMDEFICKECSKQRETVEEEELYCLCKEPYDDSRFYIGCDFCQDWFHGTCVGITKHEADTIEEYKCPNCCKNNDQHLIELKPLSAKELDGLKRLHRAMMSHKMAWPFVKPVDAKEIVDYYEKIKEPMDLQTMSKKLKEKKYKTIADFVADVSRIFDNCRLFNPQDSSFYRCAEVLENYFVQKLKGFKNTLMKK